MPVLLLVMQVVTGKPGLLLEAAVALVVAYVVGSVVGGAAAKLLPVRFEGWWVGLFATGADLAGVRDRRLSRRSSRICTSASPRWWRRPASIR